MPHPDRVKKLLAKARDPGSTPEEARAFDEKAVLLIVKYDIQIARGAVNRADAKKLVQRHVYEHLRDTYPDQVFDRNFFLQEDWARLLVAWTEVQEQMWRATKGKSIPNGAKL